VRGKTKTQSQMTSPTHISFSLFTLAFASVGQGMEFNYENALLCSIGSLTPDLDNSKSWLGRLFPFISKPIENKFSHRTLTHSLLAIVFIWSIAVLVKILFDTGNFNPLAFAIGYTSHILIDCASVQGVKILYPFSMRNAVFPFDTQQPEAYRIVVGSKADVALGFVFVFLTIPFAYISFKTHTKIVREIQRDINSAVRSYNELSKNFICWARLEGINTTTGDKLKGDYLIISAEKQNMLLIKEGSLTLSVGKDNFRNDVFTANILTIPRQKARLEIKNLSIQNQTLGNAVDLNDSLLFLTGEIEFYEPLEPIQPPPTKFEFFKQSTEHKIKLNMTTTEFIRSLNLQDKIIKSAKLTLKKITLISSPPAGEGKGEGAQKAGEGRVRGETQFILIELHPNENIRFVVKPQETIKEGQTIAYRQTTEIERLKLQINQIQSQISQTENEIKALDERLKQDTTEINLKLAQIEKEISDLEELKKRGLAGPQVTFKLEKEKEALLNKIKGKQTDAELKKGKLFLKIETLKTKIKELELKIIDLEVKNTIKSTATGRLREIRESATKTKKQFLLVLDAR
jgi:inner membrane protein